MWLNYNNTGTKISGRKEH